MNIFNTIQKGKHYKILGLSGQGKTSFVEAFLQKHLSPDKNAIVFSKFYFGDFSRKLILKKDSNIF